MKNGKSENKNDLIAYIAPEINTMGIGDSNQKSVAPCSYADETAHDGEETRCVEMSGHSSPTHIETVHLLDKEPRTSFPPPITRSRSPCKSPTLNPTTPTTCSPSFLRLPAELRSQIARHYLANQVLPIERHHPAHPGTKIKNTTSERETMLPDDLRRQFWTSRAHECDHALFFTCRALRDDYIHEINNPANSENLLHVIHIGPRMALQGSIADVLARDSLHLSRLRKVKIHLSFYGGEETGGVVPAKGACWTTVPCSRNPAMLYRRLKNVKEFLESLEGIEEVTVRLWDAEYDVFEMGDASPLVYGRLLSCPLYTLTSVLQDMATVERFTVIGNEERISCVRTRGEWMNLDRGQSLEEGERQDL